MMDTSQIKGSVLKVGLIDVSDPTSRFEGVGSSKKNENNFKEQEH